MVASERSWISFSSSVRYSISIALVFGTIFQLKRKYERFLYFLAFKLFYFSAFPRVKYEHGQRELTSALDSAVRKFERQKLHFVRRIMIYTSAYFSVLVFASVSVYNAFCVGVCVCVCVCICVFVCVCVFLASADQSSYLECSLTLTLTLTHPFGAPPPPHPPPPPTATLTAEP